MMPPVVRDQLRQRLSDQCQDDYDRAQIEPILHAVAITSSPDELHGIDFVLKVQRDERAYRAMVALIARAYRAMVALIARAYHGGCLPNPLVRPYLVPIGPIVVSRLHPVVSMAVDVLAAVVAGDCDVAWAMLDDRDSFRRTAKQAGVLGLLAWWLHDLAMSGFPDRTRPPNL